MANVGPTPHPIQADFRLGVFRYAAAVLGDDLRCIRAPGSLILRHGLALLAEGELLRAAHVLSRGKCGDALEELATLADRSDVSLMVKLTACGGLERMAVNNEGIREAALNKLIELTFSQKSSPDEYIAAGILSKALEKIDDVMLHERIGQAVIEKCFPASGVPGDHEVRNPLLSRFCAVAGSLRDLASGSKLAELLDSNECGFEQASLVAAAEKRVSREVRDALARFASRDLGEQGVRAIGVQDRAFAAANQYGPTRNNA